jgi:hypothetical protein
MKKIPPLLLILFLIKCSGCDVLPTPKEELPPITQEGKNTFGCLVNGKVWLPKGNNGTANLDLSYDLSFMGGAFNISAYSIENGFRKYITISSDSISKSGTYQVSPIGRFLTFYSELDSKGAGCDLSDFSIVKRKGQVVITKLDVGKQIASGTFEFTLYKPGCDTVKVTQGRFDIKF